VSTVLLDSLNVYNLHASLVLVYLCFNSLVYFMYVCSVGLASFSSFYVLFIVFRPTYYGQLSEIKFMYVCMYVCMYTNVYNLHASLVLVYLCLIDQ